MLENSYLGWRNKKREGYFQIARGHWVKKDDLDYFTEVDLIQRVSERHGIDEEEVADLYRVTMKYIKNLLEYPNDEEKGYILHGLGYFFKKNLYLEDLTKGKDTIRYKKAKKQLDLYMKLSKSQLRII